MVGLFCSLPIYVHVQWPMVTLFASDADKTELLCSPRVTCLLFSLRQFCGQFVCVISMSFLRVSPFKDPGPCSPQATDEFLRRVGGIATKCAQGSVFCLPWGL